MKPDIDYQLDKSILLMDLKKLEFISRFIMYKKFNLSKKKLRKKLKKLIHQIEEDKIEKYLDESINIEDYYE